MCIDVNGFQQYLKCKSKFVVMNACIQDVCSQKLKRRQKAHKTLLDTVPWKEHAVNILTLDFMSSEESAPEDEQDDHGRHTRRLSALQHESNQLTAVKHKFDRFYIKEVASREARSQLGTYRRDHPTSSMRSVPQQPSWAYVE